LTKNGPLNPSASVSQPGLRSPSATGGYGDDLVGGERGLQTAKGVDNLRA